MHFYCEPLIPSAQQCYLGLKILYSESWYDDFIWSSLFCNSLYFKGHKSQLLEPKSVNYNNVICSFNSHNVDFSGLWVGLVLACWRYKAYFKLIMICLLALALLAKSVDFRIIKFLVLFIFEFLMALIVFITLILFSK